MKIDIKNVIEKIPTMTTKSSSLNPVRPRVKTKAQDYPALGDVKRFERFPDIVDENFISLYKEDLDRFLIPYIQQGEMTVYSAHRFIENLVEQIFGNEKHFGIFSYLKERNYDGAAERELVRTSERLINSGWRVQKDKNTDRYTILNSEGSSIIDATGMSEFASKAQAITMDESSAHLFIDSVSASRIESLARSINMDADSLASIGSLDELINHTEDKNLVGKIVNYKKLRKILRKENSYPSLIRGISFTDLYQKGYTLSDKMLFSHDDRVIMSLNTEDFVVYPIGVELNKIYGFNKDLLAVIASKIKIQLCKYLPNVTSQQLVEIKDMGRVVGLISDYWQNDTAYMSYSDLADALRRLDMYVKSGEVTKDFYNRVFSAFASIMVMEYILFGNNWSSISMMGLDTISGKFYSYASRDVFTFRKEEFDYIYRNYKPMYAPPQFSLFTTSIFPLRDNRNFSAEQNAMDLLPILVENLPKEFFTAITSVDMKIEGYPFQFSGVTEHINKATDFLMTRSK
jgi:hypothetical protein